MVARFFNSRLLNDDRGRRVLIQRRDRDALEALKPWQRWLVITDIVALGTVWLWWYPFLMVTVIVLSAFRIELTGTGEEVVLKSVFPLLFVPLFWLIWPPRANRSVARSRLRNGVCGACQYRLAGLEAGDDGCVRCPECGASWQASRIAPATSPISLPH